MSTFTFNGRAHTEIIGIDGWINAAGTWTYASANTITVPTNATLTYQKGWGVRWKQGGAYKYAYITVVAATLLTVNGGTDYTVANSAITDIAYCPNPAGAFGFPAFFNYTVTPTSLTVVGTPTYSGRFWINGGRLFFYVQMVSTTTIASTLGTSTMNNPPVAPAYAHAVCSSTFGQNLGNSWGQDTGGGVIYLCAWTATGSRILHSGNYLY